MSQERGRPRLIDGEPRAAPARWLAGSVRTAAFWVAVVLPLAYPPAFLYAGAGADGLPFIGGLLAVHLAALSLGHDHRQD